MSTNPRDVHHKRQHRHVARDLSQDKDQTQPVVASPSSPSIGPNTSDVATPVSSQAPASKTIDTPAKSPPHSTPSSATPTPSSSLSSSSSPPTSSSTPDSSSVTSAASSTVSTLSAVSSLTASLAPVSTKVVVPGTSLTYLVPTPTTTSSSGSSGGTNTGTIVGGIAGALAGIALLGFLLMWCMRRQRNKDIDDFDAQAFKRQSAMLVDDPVEPPQSYNPRPPTMIERHNASPALAAQAGYGGQNFYGSYGGYGQQSSYATDMMQPVGSPPPQAYGAPPMGYAAFNDPQPPIARQPSNVGYPVYDTQQQLARQPSNAEYLTRQPSAAVGYAPPNPPSGPVEPGTQYIDLRRSSVSPYQAAQYADISRQLGTVDPNAQDALELPDDPLPSPFDDPVQPTQGAPSHAAAPGPAAVVPVPQGSAAQPQHRPVTVYHESDAYGGI